MSIMRPLFRALYAVSGSVLATASVAAGAGGVAAGAGAAVTHTISAPRGSTKSLRTAIRYGAVLRRHGSATLTPHLSGSQPCVATCSSIKMSYFGGPVVSNPQVVVIYWGSAGTFITGASPTSNEMDNFYSTVGQSDWFQSLNQYNTTIPGGTDQVIGTASVTPAYDPTPTHCATSSDCTLTDAEEQAQLSAWISSGAIPAPTIDTHGYDQTIYALLFPGNLTLDGPDGAGNDLTDFCAYHNTATDSLGTNFPYMVLPTYGGTDDYEGCGSDPTEFDDLTDTASHELAESTTDPDIGLDTQSTYAYPAAWASNQVIGGEGVGEIADACDTGAEGYDEDGYYVQAIFSNAYAGCYFSVPYANLSPSQAMVARGAAQSFSAVTNGDVNTTNLSLSISPTTGASCSANSCTADDTGTYLVSGTASGVATDSAVLTVTAAPLTVTAPSPLVTYGQAIPPLNPEYNGFVGSDSASSLSSQATCTTTATAGSPVGTYPVTCSGASDPGQYTFSYVAGTLRVTPAPLSVTAPSPTIEYGQSVPALTPQYGGFVNGDTAASLSSQATCGTTAPSSPAAGSYTVTCSGAADPNYEITDVPGTLTVSTAPLTVTAPSPTIFYGEAPPASFTPSYGGFADGDSASSLTTLPTCGTTAPSAPTVGSYAVTCTGAVDSNYSVSYVPGTLTVLPAPLTVSSRSAYMKVTATHVPALMPVYEGFQYSDSAASLSSRAKCTTTAVVGDPTGLYPVTCSGAAGADYDISYVAGTLTIDGTPEIATVSATSGPAVGGTTLTITGSQFSGLRAVDFGGKAGTDLNLVSDSEIEVTTPARPAGGTVSITVVTHGGKALAAETFTYLTPSISSLSQSSGPLAGENVIEIDGSGFTGVTSVLFGTVASSEVVFQSDSEISVVVPPSTAPRTVSVKVIAADGTTPAAVEGHYRYVR